METISKKPKSDNLNCNTKWSDLPKEVVQLILKKLPFVDLLRFKALSTSSLLLQKSYISSSFYSPAPQTPWLMLPSDQVDEPNSCRFFSLSEKKVYKLDNVVDGFRGWIFCVGSSYGWLVISDEKDNPSLLNPFSVRIGGRSKKICAVGLFSLLITRLWRYVLEIFRNAKRIRFTSLIMNVNLGYTSYILMMML
nr:putative F-box protein At4g22660 isoform X2 [Ziziphus jujuba var. spinosa]